MANELVKMVAKKANISEPVAQIAVDTVLKMMKTKLPPAVGGTLDAVLSSSGSTQATASKSSAKKTNKNDHPLGDLGNIAGKLGGLLGKK
jgi:uncharacterized protein (DUF2267 family)